MPLSEVVVKDVRALRQGILTGKIDPVKVYRRSRTHPFHLCKCALCATVLVQWYGPLKVIAPGGELLFPGSWREEEVAQIVEPELLEFWRKCIEEGNYDRIWRGEDWDPVAIIWRGVEDNSDPGTAGIG